MSRLLGSVVRSCLALALAGGSAAASDATDARPPALDGAADTLLAAQQPGAGFGFAAASAGDVDGDGFDDLIVGAHLYDRGQTDEGAAFVFLGSPATSHARGEAAADGVPGSSAIPWPAVVVVSLGVLIVLAWAWWGRGRRRGV